MRPLRRRKPNYEHIAKLELELGLNEPPQEPRRKNPDWNPNKVVDLSHHKSMAALAHKIDVEGMVLRPGVKWEVEDASSIQYLTTSATSVYPMNHVQIIKNSFAQRGLLNSAASVIVPDGVRLQ